MDKKPHPEDAMRRLLHAMYNEPDDVRRVLARVELEARAPEFLNFLLGTNYGYPPCDAESCRSFQVTD